MKTYPHESFCCDQDSNPCSEGLSGWKTRTFTVRPQAYLLYCMYVLGELNIAKLYNVHLSFIPCFHDTIQNCLISKKQIFRVSADATSYIQRSYFNKKQEFRLQFLNSRLTVCIQIPYFHNSRIFLFLCITYYSIIHISSIHLRLLKNMRAISLKRGFLLIIMLTRPAHLYSLIRSCTGC